MRQSIRVLLVGILASWKFLLPSIHAQPVPIGLDIGSGKRANLDDQVECWPAVKRIPLNQDGSIHLSLTGELREFPQYYSEPLFGFGEVEEDHYLWHRLQLGADLHLGKHVRVFVELGNYLEAWKRAPRTATEVDELDLHQGFVDFSLPLGNKNDLTLRVGRHEMEFGSARLVTTREGSNIPLSFDGARLRLNTGKATFDAFAVRPVRTRVGVFNDDPDPSQTFWGIYSVLPVSVLPEGQMDVYYLGLERKNSVFQEGISDEYRHTYGIRLFGKPGSWDYDYEAIAQTGRFDQDDIRAFAFASDTGYTFQKAPLRPRLGLKANIASGDRRPDDGLLNTFNPLFPRQAYFSQATLLSPQNLIDVHPSLTLHLTRNLTFVGDVDFFWKHRVDDAIYTPPGQPLVPAGLSNSRYVGSQANAWLTWQVNNCVSVNLYYSHFFAGPAVTEAGGRDVDFAATWVTLVF